MTRNGKWRSGAGVLMLLGGVAMVAGWRAAAADVAALPPAALTRPDFSREVRPIFASHCTQCHGVEKQKAGLRLDVKAAALKGGDNGPVILPGRSAASKLIQLVAGLEPDRVMPQKGERLTTEQIGVLRAWIDHGAAWPEGGAGERVRSEHWALQALKKPAIPVISRTVISNQSPGRGPASLITDPLTTDYSNPIDAFITARLVTNGLALAPEADRATLIRRLSFDLLGLPPTPREIDEFVDDQSPRAYERLVDRLLASPRYGERWARHWLDVARYTESQGFEYDKLRDNAWHYRDYVIRSFNDDKPYDQFMREQIAGDVLEPVTGDGIIAASLLVCGPWDEAGNSQANATQKAITREEEMEDLISVVGQTFLGLTINCARCHSHKFDPIPQEEYFRVKAVFDGVKHGERAIAPPAEVKAREERIAKLQQRIAATQEAVTRLEGEGAKRAAARQTTNSGEPAPLAWARWNFDGAANAVPGELKDGAVIADGKLKLPKAGAHYQTAPLPRDVREKTLEAWVELDDLEQGGGAAISIETDGGRIFDAIVFGERQPKKWTAGSIGFQRTKDLDAAGEAPPLGMLVHMVAVYRADDSIAVFRNGVGYGEAYTPTSPLQTYAAGRSHVLLGMRHTGGGRPFLTGAIRRAALYDRALSKMEVVAAFRASGLLGVTTAEAVAELDEAHKRERTEALARIQALRKELEAIKAPPVSYAGRRVQPPPTHRLRRGDVKLPLEVVTPGGLSAIVDLESDFALPADAPEAQRRVKFAAWVSDPRHPLPARVMVNRIWHWHFGQGLVATPNDFGASGAGPSHPELLDWLAGRFIASGWSVKALHRLIVNSATYRQGSSVNSKTVISNHSAKGVGAASLITDYFQRASGIDADNQLLWRFPPRRLEAEVLRDAMLAVSGEINLQAGGPSFRPFEVLKFPANAYAPVDRADPEFNRRTVYRMNVNSGKEPLLDAFDCPDPSVKTPRRGVTTTPLQALALMNNSFVQRQADKLAARALLEASGDLPKAIAGAYRLALGRPATRAELERATAAARERGLAKVCWALLNATEFVYVR